MLERAGRPEPADRSTAAELGRALVRAAEKLPRPTPIPMLVTGLFEDDPSRMRGPNDPTGGITRPAPADEPVALVPPVAEHRDRPTAEVRGRCRHDARRSRGRRGRRGRRDRRDAAAVAQPAPRPRPMLRRRPPLPPPVVDDESPRLYDGDADRTVDELAALAKRDRRCGGPFRRGARRRPEPR